MKIYRFVSRAAGAQIEELGVMPLRDDRDAVAFGKLVVRDMVQGAPPQKPAPVVEVVDGRRTVGTIGPNEVT